MFEKIGYTKIDKKTATTRFNVLEGEWKNFQLEVYTYKNDRNLLITTAKICKIEKRENFVFVSYIPFQYPFKTVLCEDCPRLSQKKLQEQHERALDIVQSEGFTL